MSENLDETIKNRIEKLQEAVLKDNDLIGKYKQETQNLTARVFANQGAIAELARLKESIKAKEAKPEGAKE